VTAAAPATASQRHVEAFAHQLVVTLVNHSMHAPQSQELQDSLGEALRELGAAATDGARCPLRLELTGTTIQHEGRTLLAASLQAGRLLRLCLERRIAALEFAPTLGLTELQRFLVLLNDPKMVDAFTPANLTDAMAAHGVRGVTVQLGPAQPPAPAADGRSDGLEQYQAMTDLLQASHVAAARGEELEVERAATFVELAMERMEQEPSQLLGLAAYDEIDSFTVGHSVRVALLALQVARTCGATPQQLVRVGTAGLLHDIGKSRIPQQILFKKGELTPEEWQEMSKHPRLGGEILLEQRQLDPSVIGAAFCHHMGPNGSGYPRPMLPFEPSGLSKLIRVCDVFEALTAVRPYKRALAPLHAYAVMHRMQDAFDPRWLRHFVRTIGLFPPGTRVFLDDGSEAIVIAHGADTKAPIVRLVAPLAGAPAELAVGVPVDGVVRRIDSVFGCGARVKVPVLEDAPCGCLVPPGADPED
jgi:putative nucleotidyltransferase with HDIG domain